ncbi:MAG: phosphoenolpyruvate--protein phosphotransferase [Lachnospiraceae bacterium]|nr:phosphoenolpyruvate--protein phosphotransferase [Lachnospiraceae bacterium]
MKEYSLHVASKGFYAGPVFAAESGKAAVIKRNITDTGEEVSRFEAAVAKMTAGLDAGNYASRTQEVMDTVRLFLTDEAFLDEIKTYIRKEKCNAEYATTLVAYDYARRLKLSESEYLRERSEDIEGVAKGLTDVLSGRESAELTRFSAIVTDEISPAQLGAFDQSLIGGLITDKGSPTSHVAVIMSAIGAPYLYGAGAAVEEIKKAAYVIIDSEKVIIDPDGEMRAAAQERMKAVAEDRRQAESDDVCCRMRVCANIAGPEDMAEVAACGADGVGLFRTELLFLGRDSMPDEDEQYEAYTAVLDETDDEEVIIRTMDIGSDKKPRWMKLPDESNPALGMRGVRVSLENEKIFKVQLRALLRAAVYGNLKVMFPMIASAWEIDRITHLMEEAADELELEGTPIRMPDIGIMIETPAAAVMAEELAAGGKIKFFSIGTNDLTQYTLALDREAQGLERYYDPQHEAVLRLVRMVVEGGHKHAVTVGICGQMAADTELTARFVEMGVDELSVPAKLVRRVRVAAAKAESAGGSVCAAEAMHKGGEILGAFADGELIPMAEIPDRVFAEGTMGTCVGICPQNGSVYAPCSGRIGSVASTKHAITMMADDGTEYLIHVGIDTVKMNGRGFNVMVRDGQRVEKGTQLMEVNLNMIKAAGLSDMIILVRLNKQ